MCDETYRRRKVAHRVSAISSSSKSDNSSNEKDDNDEQFAPTKEGEQNEVLQSTDEEGLGRAAQYERVDKKTSAFERFTESWIANGFNCFEKEREIKRTRSFD